MQKNEIEEKDRQVVQKVRKIVENKEKKTFRKKVFWKAPGFWLPMLCIGLVVFGLTAFRQPSTTAVQPVADQTPKTVMADAPPLVATERADEAVESTALADTKNDATPAELDAPADSPPSEETVEPEAAPSPSPAAAIVPEKQTADSSAAATEATPESLPTEKPGLSSGIQITDLVTCGGVRGKQFISPKSVFSLATDPMAMVWMRVLSVAPPHTLTHVYFVNGKHYCDVPLEIPYPHMRTWSKVTIDRDIHIGQWRVDVVTESGEKLDQIEFTVVP
jgi:hypothetical protein